MGDDETMAYCACCERRVPVGQWSWLYSSCADCAFCSSLEHFEPCHHGSCKSDKEQR